MRPLLSGGIHVHEIAAPAASRFGAGRLDSIHRRLEHAKDSPPRGLFPEVHLRRNHIAWRCAGEKNRSTALFGIEVGDAISAQG